MLKKHEALEWVVQNITVELMDYGGTNPQTTCEAVAGEASELYKAFGQRRVLALCETVHRSDIPIEAARFQELFRTFNTKYFAGQLPEYEVRVVYDVASWSGSFSAEVSSGFIDLDRRRICIGATECVRQMPFTLIRFMAHAATQTIDDLGGKWIREMRRLEANPEIAFMAGIGLATAP